MSVRIPQPEVKSGTVQGVSNIKKAYRQAIRNALEIAIPDALRQFGKTVAQLTGDMRSGVESTGGGADKRKIVVRALTRGSEIIIREQDIIDTMLDNEWKIQFHMRQSTNFNQKFAAGYKNPSTPNTRPIDAGEAMQYIRTRTIAEIPKQLRLQGFELK